MDGNIETELLFLVVISNGYSFRNMIEYLKATNKEGHFTFRKSGITYQEADVTHCLLNDISIRACDLQKYVINSEDPILLGVELAEFRGMTNKIQTKDAFCWYQKKSEPGMFHCQIISDLKSAGSNSSFLREKDIEPTEYNDLVYTRDLTSPNANCSLPEFTKKCKNIASVKCKHIHIHGYQQGVSFTAAIDGNITGSVEKIGKCETETKYPSLTDLLTDLSVDKPSFRVTVNNDIPVVRVEKSIVKALGKMNNISKDGIVKIYLEKDMPMRVICDIGHYGNLIVHIKDNLG